MPGAAIVIPALASMFGSYYMGQAGGGQTPEQQYSQYGGPTPDYNDLYDMMIDAMGGPEGMQELLDAATPGEPGSVYEGFMENLAPMGADYTPERREAFVGEYIRKLLSGEGAAKRAGEFRTRGREDVQRTYKGAYDALRERTASAGGRHSSAHAKGIAEGTLGYQTALGGVESQAASYEDMLRQSMFGQGMGIQNMLTSMQRGDYTQMLQYSEQLLNVLAPMMELYGIDQATMLQMMGFEQGIAEAWGGTEEGAPYPEMMYETPTNPDPNDPYAWYSET